MKPNKPTGVTGRPTGTKPTPTGNPGTKTHDPKHLPREFKYSNYFT
jgi:hypothetical protein